MQNKHNTSLQTSTTQSPSRKFKKFSLNFTTNSTTTISHSYTMELRRGLFNKVFHFHWAFPHCHHPVIISGYGSHISNKKMSCKHIVCPASLHICSSQAFWTKQRKTKFWQLVLKRRSFTSDRPNIYIQKLKNSVRLYNSKGSVLGRCLALGFWQVHFFCFQSNIH